MASMEREDEEREHRQNSTITDESYRVNRISANCSSLAMSSVLPGQVTRGTLLSRSQCMSLGVWSEFAVRFSQDLTNRMVCDNMTFVTLNISEKGRAPFHQMGFPSLMLILLFVQGFFASLISDISAVKLYALFLIFSICSCRFQNFSCSTVALLRPRITLRPST